MKLVARSPAVATKRYNLLLQIGLLVCLSAATFSAVLPTASFAQEGESASTSQSPDIETLGRPDLDKSEFLLRIVHLTGDQLAKLAEEWLALTQEQTREAARVNIELSKAPPTQEQSLREQLNEALRERNLQFRKLGLIVEEWEAKGGKPEDTARYEKYAAAVLHSEFEVTDLDALLSYIRKWLTSPEGGWRLVSTVVSALLWLTLLYALASVMTYALRRRLKHERRVSSLLRSFLSRMAFWVFLLLGGLFLLSLHGVDLTPLLAALGGASFIAAFALQDTLGNLASGLMIMIYRPFDEGDYVDVGGTAGTVKSVSVVATTVTTPDNQIIVIPNKNVWGSTITNVTASAIRRVDLVFGIGYDDSIENAVRKIEAALSSHPLILKTPEPIIRVGELADSSVNIICRPWVNTADYWTVYWELTRNIKEAFDEAGISFAYPQLDVHVKVEPGALPQS